MVATPSPESRKIPVPERTSIARPLQVAARETTRRRHIRFRSPHASPAVTFEGKRYTVDLSKSKAWSGLPWSNGLLRLEKNPKLVPLKARGLGHDPGTFWDLYNTPHVEAMVEDLVAAISSAPMQPRPTPVPDFIRFNRETHELAARRHAEFGARLWKEWTRPGRAFGLRGFVGDSLRTVVPFGFYNGEIVAKPFVWRLEGDPHPRVYWVPDLPEWRAPWSVTDWITQGDQYVGVVLRNSQATDSYGKTGESRVVLPMEKLVHIVGRRCGPNPEGRSHMRSSHTILTMLRIALEVESLSIEANGTGTRVVTQDKDRPIEGDDEIDKIKDHLANYKARHLPWMVMPPGTDMKTDSPQSSVAELGAPISRYERAIGFGMGNLSDLVATQKHGSNSAREDASKEKWAPFTHLAQDYVMDPLARLIGQFVRFNFPEDDVRGMLYSPGVHIGQVERQDVHQRVATLALAREKGLLDDTRTAGIVADMLGLDLGVIDASAGRSSSTTRALPGV